ncbi:MAG: uroporphyrinogen-III C-methyltransferase [Hyphomicrobium sp.]|jgi:uroporphyrin-III C-methyltransferase/precorrin-2 dehydrogenase/sirohydrochlorin ferrochelatase
MRGALTLGPTLAELLAVTLQRVGGIVRATIQRRDGHPAATASRHVKNAHIWLVGAGPGDPELLTIKALRALQTADVILHDQLVSDEILALAPTHVERIDVGKKGYGRACRQSDINALMVGHACAGRRVVRLKAGDPLMFGRLDEEIAALEHAGIGYTVVPGISAAQGAASALGIGLTRRRGARRFQAITGHAAAGQLPDDFDWAGLADPKATTAVYMPRATIGVLCAELQRRGLAPSHAAVAVFNATRADQQIVGGTLATLPQRIAAVESGAPCIILIGVRAENHPAKAIARSPVAACLNA